jgi:NADP-dependent 3-hydroxy acid dehydrogenase YdfG
VGNIDVLFVNAGVAKFAPFDETSERAYGDIFDINIKGALLHDSESPAAVE